MIGNRKITTVFMAIVMCVCMTVCAFADEYWGRSGSQTLTDTSGHVSETLKVNTTLQVHVPLNIFDQWIKSSGRSVTTAAINYPGYTCAMPTGGHTIEAKVYGIAASITCSTSSASITVGSGTSTVKITADTMNISYVIAKAKAISLVGYSETHTSTLEVYNNGNKVETLVDSVVISY